MKTQESKSFNRAPEGAKKNSSSNSAEDWKTVLVDIILKILTLGLYHVEKHTQKKD